MSKAPKLKLNYITAEEQEQPTNDVVSAAWYDGLIKLPFHVQTQLEN